MDQETKTILSVARAFKNYIESEGVAKKTLNNLKYLSENDHLVNILFSMKSQNIFSMLIESLIFISNKSIISEFLSKKRSDIIIIVFKRDFLIYAIFVKNIFKKS